MNDIKLTTDFRAYLQLLCMTVMHSIFPQCYLLQINIKQTKTVQTLRRN